MKTLFAWSTNAVAAPHPFTSLMPDLVEQSRDANECVCLREGFQTTVVEGLNSEEKHPLSGAKLLRLHPSLCLYSVYIHYKVYICIYTYVYVLCMYTYIYKCIYVCIHTHTLLLPEAGTLKNVADCQGGNKHSIRELTIVSANVKGYHRP